MTSNLVNINRYNPPNWFKQADLGIFIHWGPYSVPAYAPIEEDDFDQIVKKRGLEYLFVHTPYAEWYQNSLRIKNSPVYDYHKKNYPNLSYEDFVKDFRASAKNVDIEAWVDLFSKAKAKYLVIVSKHHDGFVMFDSKHKNPNIDDYCLDFDFVGDLAKACRKKDIKFGVYYSSLLDWTFTKEPIKSSTDILLGNDKSKTYADYCYNHWIEIIDRYKPDILWSDIGYPWDQRLEDLFAYYYKEVPNGLVNDRWGQWPNYIRNPLGKLLFSMGARIVEKKGGSDPAGTKYFDYKTLEYTSNWTESQIYFEVCRGMDKSFGYNKYSSKKDYISIEEIEKIISDIYPKKGRLLLNVGPDMNGNIPDYQENILKDLEKIR